MTKPSLVGFSEQTRGVKRRERQRRLAEEVLAGRQGRRAHRGVRVGVGGDDDRVHVRTRNRGFPVLRVLHAESFSQRGASFWIASGDGHEVHVGAGRNALGSSHGHAAAADDGDAQWGGRGISHAAFSRAL